MNPVRKNWNGRPDRIFRRQLSERRKNKRSGRLVEVASDFTSVSLESVQLMLRNMQIQWIDNGPPKTESRPGGRSTRYFRVLWVTK